MKIYTAQDIRAWETQTLHEDNIDSYALMERAANAFCQWWPYTPDRPVVVLCGTGNNGGDGLAIARFLSYIHPSVSVYEVPTARTASPNMLRNKARLAETTAVLRGTLVAGQNWPHWSPDTVVIDALWGIGLSRPLDGFWADLFAHIAQTGAEVVAVDLPSGLLPDAPTPPQYALRATHTVTFQVPKMAFFIPENEDYIGKWHIVDIGLTPHFDKPAPVFLTDEWARQHHQQRPVFTHKGAAGKALLVCGSYGMAGAAVLSAKACLRAGVGLLTVQTPQSNRVVLQTAVPEAMVRVDADEFVVSQQVEVADFSAIGIGCGLGRAGRTASAVQYYLTQADKPLVVDADALNLLAVNPHWWQNLSKNCIFTPHLKEFERLFGTADNHFERLNCLRQRAQERQVVVVLKGAHTAIALPDGRLFINSTGNPGMATGGSGDVLTGFLTALLAQGYAPDVAAPLGVFLHGRAGDLAAAVQGQEALIASDLVDYIGKAFLSLQKDNK